MLTANSDIVISSLQGRGLDLDSARSMVKTASIKGFDSRVIGSRVILVEKNGDKFTVVV